MRLTILTAAVVTFAVPARAQCQSGYCPRPPGRVVYYRAVPPPVAYVPVYQAAPQPAPLAPTYQAAGGGYAAALAVINGARASAGRGPLAWSATLAAYAASNTGVHAPGSSGGAGQCWAGVADPVAAARMWLGSPAHWAILVNATTEVGISTCPTGVTCNAR